VEKSESPDRWLTPRELSELLQIPISTLYQWTYKSVGPPSHKIGRHVRYRLSEVNEWAMSK
jgi:excisionase family DNA binding protein